MRGIRRTRVRGAALAVTFAAVLLAGAQSASADSPRRVTVLTRNLYLGADLNPIFGATTPAQLFAAVGAAFANVQATNFPLRSVRIANEIVRWHPDFVGLQEAVIWRTGPLLDPAPATAVRYDFLKILLDRLARRGLHYRPVAIHTGFDGEAPGSLGFDVRLTDRDVLLVNADSHLKLSHAEAHSFSTNLTIPSPVLGTVTALRGWTQVDVKLRGKSFRLIETHLETEAAPPIQVAQAAELLAGPAHTAMPVLMVGDFNSAADGSTTVTYANLAHADLKDAWVVAHRGNPGFTCCQAADLANPVSTLSERIDLVLFRGRFSGGFTFHVERAARLGARSISMIGGLWPSDHAGVVVRFGVER